MLGKPTKSGVPVTRGLRMAGEILNALELKLRSGQDPIHTLPRTRSLPRTEVWVCQGPKGRTICALKAKVKGAETKEVGREEFVRIIGDHIDGMKPEQQQELTHWINANGDHGAAKFRSQVVAAQTLLKATLRLLGSVDLSAYNLELGSEANKLINRIEEHLESTKGS